LDIFGAGPVSVQRATESTDRIRTPMDPVPEADGRQRPVGNAALEDKIVQQAVKTVLESIYEEDFLGFNYGFRPGRSCYNALGALRGGHPAT
jgi:retron-type reverse transcriptase